MSRILVATQVPEGREWFGNPVSWEAFCRIVREEFSKDVQTSPSRRRDPTIDKYVVIRTSYANAKGRIDTGTPVETNLVKYPESGPKDVVYGDAALIDMLGEIGHCSSTTNYDYNRGNYERQQDRYIRERVGGIFEAVRLAIDKAFPFILETTLDLSLAADPKDLLKPESDEHFYLHGNEVFVKEYLESLPPGGGWRRTVLE